MRDLTFRYDGERAPALTDVAFTLREGSRNALVGPSGAGKSTLIALLERFYSPTSGRIELAGVDLRRWPRAQLRQAVAAVEQEAGALAGTLRENLLLAEPEADDGELLAVLDTVRLRPLLERCPRGLDTQVGDAGVLISGGERQRLAIARALLRAPRLLLLDEPTAHLDARNEAALRDTLDDLAGRCTLPVVAHRLSTVVRADAILVLDEGRLVDVGRHEQLLGTSPLYRELATQQLLTTA